MTLVSVKNLSVSYGTVEAINDINLEIEKGDFLCVIGPNGGGKTTFLNTVLGILKPDSGEILINGKTVKNSDAKISYVPQISSIDRNFPIGVIDTVLMGNLRKGLHPFKKFSESEKQKAKKILSAVGLKGYSKRQISELSGGEFQRLLIARAIFSEPEMLILDEPTANVDIAFEGSIFSLLHSLNQKGLTIIAVTHNLKAAAENSTKLAFINQTLKYFGKPVSVSQLTSFMYGESEVV